MVEGAMKKSCWFVPVIALLATVTTAAAQQTKKAARIGLLSPGTLQRQMQNPRMQAFFQGLRELGWVDGKNLIVERRFANDQLSQLDGLAVDLASLKVDVIVTAAYPAAKAAKNATDKIPVVILDPGDPVGTGLVASLARPGGNVTGISQLRQISQPSAYSFSRKLRQRSAEWPFFLTMKFHPQRLQ
jgi:putative ABC transport system substrate-binding protein